MHRILKPHLSKPCKQKDSKDADTGVSGYSYMLPTNWTGSGGGSTDPRNVIIQNGNTSWGSTAANDGGYFVGLKKHNAYIEQEITVIPNLPFHFLIRTK